ncbi:oligosaccharide flippase family protein [Antarcticibacterium sp. 1MA-6-2]|uniref:oligosaccharide flippase family protein n=1 Tax=Antarcticibacterium sp. 1MA-6-2 TaxID=2908210 RepID=UPI0021032CD2|nr:oligosaccharide flippase family protein [Antarcticibacterium sp. 1MA-6-2]
MWKGIFYNAISKYSGVLINLGITAILSRVLTPEEFGIVALVFVFIGFFNLLGNMGIGPAIVQTLDLTEDDIGSIFAFSGLMALVLAVFFFFKWWHDCRVL